MPRTQRTTVPPHSPDTRSGELTARERNVVQLRAEARAIEVRLAALRQRLSKLRADDWRASQGAGSDTCVREMGGAEPRAWS